MDLRRKTAKEWLELLVEEHVPAANRDRARRELLPQLEPLIANFLRDEAAHWRRHEVKLSALMAMALDSDEGGWRTWFEARIGRGGALVRGGYGSTFVFRD